MFHPIVNVNGYDVICWNTESVREKQRITLIPALRAEKKDNVKKPEHYWNIRCSSWGKYKATGIPLNSVGNNPFQVREFQYVNFKYYQAAN